MDERDLKKVVIHQNLPFTGLRVADNILTGMGQNLTALVLCGELHVVPSRGSVVSAREMVKAEFWAKEAPAPKGAQMDEAIERLIALHGEHIKPTEAQLERLRQDSLRSQARFARAKEQTQA